MTMTADTALTLPLSFETTQLSEGYATTVYDGNERALFDLFGPDAEAKATAIVEAVNGRAQNRTTFEAINLLLSPDNRTFDELIVAAGRACDLARAALSGEQP